MLGAEHIAAGREPKETEQIPTLPVNEITNIRHDQERSGDRAPPARHRPTLAELMTAAGWQAHSVRGFISGTLRKKLGLAIEATKSDRERVYKIDR